jgi:hypothetical protein
MSYKQFYLDARDVAAKIRSGEYKQEKVTKAATVDPTSVLPRRQTKEVAPYDPSGENDKAFQDMLLSYMMNARGPQPTDADTSFKGGEGGQGFKPVDGPLSAAREAIAAVESSGNYSAIGPVVEKGMYKGQRAIGRYQVMEGNIGPWTEEALGKRMTTEEFLADQAAQDAVVEYQLSKSVKKYGTYEDAASVWFSGQPVSKAGNRDDGYTTVPQYVAKFQTHFKKFAGNENIDAGSKQSPRIVPRPKGKSNV